MPPPCVSGGATHGADGAGCRGHGDCQPFRRISRSPRRTGASFIARLSVAVPATVDTPRPAAQLATAALEARVPVEVTAAARLGNTPRMVQEVCSHVIPADDKAAAQVVGDLFRQRGVTNR